MKRKVIVSLMVAVFATMSSFAIPNVALANAEDNHYCGFGSFESKEETINYARKETESYNIKGEVPNYNVLIGETTCANIAGTILVGYYDRMCENLIPDYKSYVKIGSIIKYKGNSNETESLMNELHNLMGTGASGLGTTFNGFHNGMRTYVNNHQYTYETEDIGNLNFEKYKSAVENNKPVALFLDEFSFISSIDDSGTTEKIMYDYSSVAHMAIGYGYKIDTYYNSSNQIIMKRTYLKVASGIDSYGLTYLCLDGKSIIDRATSVLIK